MSELPGRQTLRSWLGQKPENAFTSNRNLLNTLKTIDGGDPTLAESERLTEFGKLVAGDLYRMAFDYERPENVPVLRRWTGIGERTEEVEFHPSYFEAGRKIWGAGMIAIQAERGKALEQATMFYMLTQNGEAGHACPVACTNGLVRALQKHGSEDLRENFLPRLLDPDWDQAHIGAQFMTEVQGGSDVGANVIEARPDPDHEGGWKLYGEKWFCSVANADQFLMTARVEGAGPGTGGLGCFLVPRIARDGTTNRFFIRRLKTKLGTRAMASGEMDFDGAEAYPIGPLKDGFRIAAGVVLNTSRWINALGSTGIMRGAYVEALGYAANRTAFGGKIGRFPLVRETLAIMKSEEAAALSSTLYLSTLIDRIEPGEADEHEKALYRFIVNANKYITSIAASDVTHAALEVFGGNGAIEDFSSVPRLLRDNFVFESWEGTHNVLAMQVLRDSARFSLFGNVHDAVHTTLGGLTDPALRAEAETLETRLAEYSDQVSRSLTEPRFGAAHFRRQLTNIMRLFQSARMLLEAEREKAAGLPTEKADIAAFYIRRHLMPDYRPEDDADWSARIDRILEADLGPAED